MPRKTGKVPSYCHHRASGQAVVRLDGVDHYLGTHGSPESHECYERAIAQWRTERQSQLATSSTTVQNPQAHSELTVEQLIALYWQFAKTYYIKQGKPTGELANVKHALRPCRRLYGSLPVPEFGPLALKTLRNQLIEDGICRRVVNARHRQDQTCFPLGGL